MYATQARVLFLIRMDGAQGHGGSEGSQVYEEILYDKLTWHEVYIVDPLALKYH